MLNVQSQLLWALYLAKIYVSTYLRNVLVKVNLYQLVKFEALVKFHTLVKLYLPIITYVMMIIPWSKSDLARSPVEVFSGMRMWHGT